MNKVTYWFVLSQYRYTRQGLAPEIWGNETTKLWKGAKAQRSKWSDAAREDKQGCWGVERHQLILIEAKET